MNSKINIKDITIFALIGALMYVSKLALAILPNVHLLAVIILSVTVVYRKKALYPIYIYVLIEGIFAGFATWWIPYLYIWTVLWSVIMLLPRDINTKFLLPIYMAVCFLHGLLFGTMYAPVQAVIYGMSFEATVAWIIAGLPYDFIHAVSNLAVALLAPVLIKLLKKYKNMK